jgi:hypothetical protein
MMSEYNKRSGMGSDSSNKKQQAVDSSSSNNDGIHAIGSRRNVIISDGFKNSLGYIREQWPTRAYEILLEMERLSDVSQKVLQGLSNKERVGKAATIKTSR